ncbi:MAG: ABC transporter ATP-binding protein [Actinomycetota bacterium]
MATTIIDTGSAAAATSPAAAPVLELRDVVREYPGSPPVRAIDGVSLRVDEGELVAIVGPSGSGKSTLMNLIGTLDRPTAGSLLIDGSDTGKLSDRALSGLRAARIGFVFQQFHLLAGMSALENVTGGLLYRGVSRSARRRRAADALERVGLADRMDHTPNKLSGGERQRVAIARALVGDPAIVLADEPTGNLDTRTSNEIVELLHDLHRDGSTILVITHDMELAAQFPRRVAVRDGRLEHDTGTRSAEAAPTTSGERDRAFAPTIDAEEITA